MDRGRARAWVAGHAMAEKRTFDVMQVEGAPSPEVSFAYALELLDLVANDEREDPVRERELSEARAAWAKLRAWAAGHDKR